jgi:hypothetical protein
LDQIQRTEIIVGDCGERYDDGEEGGRRRIKVSNINNTTPSCTSINSILLLLVLAAKERDVNLI